MNGPCAILLPAAGQSRRMGGRDKLVETIKGQALLRRSAERAVAASALVAVTLPAEIGPRADCLAGLNVARLIVTDATEGMAASLRAGAAWAAQAGARALMVALPDMPDITTEDMRTLIAAQREMPQSPLRATTERGLPGHPTILPAHLFVPMLALRGDEGARALLRAAPPRLHPLPGTRALTDLDTPEAWAEWQAKN